MTCDFEDPAPRRLPRLRRTGAFALACAFVLLLAGHGPDARAQKLTPLPSLSQRVNDNVALLSDQDDSELNALLTRFRAEKGVEAFVLTIASTGSETIDEYGARLVRNWMTAHPGVNDVVVFVVARDNRPDSNRVCIAAPPKLRMTEFDLHRIVEEDILPRFRTLDYGPGLMAGVDRVKRVLGGESLPNIVEPTVAIPRTRARTTINASIAAAALAIVALLTLAIRHVRTRRMVHLTGRRPLNRSFEPMLAGRVVGRRRRAPTEEDDGNGFGGGFGVTRGPIGSGDFSGGGASGSW